MLAMSAGGCPLSPNIRFSRTVSHGNTDPCCEMRIPRELGFSCGVPSMTTLPLSGLTNPAIRFNSVVLPHPEGPTSATNSPSWTLKLMFSMTSRRPLSDGKLLLRPRTSSLVRIAPPDPAVSLQQAHQTIQRQSDQTDDDHSGDHQVVAIAGIAGVHDHVTQSGVQGDHFGRHDDQPCNAEPYAHAHHDLRQYGWDHYASEQRAARDTEVFGCSKIALLDRVYAHGGLYDHGKH